MTPADLGRLLRCARRGQDVTLHELSQRTGLSVRLLSEAERGKPGVSVGRILQMAAVLGVEMVAQPAGSLRIEVERYPELRLLAWQRAGRFVDERDALALYEANWRFVDRARLIPREAALIRQLVEHHGNGVLNV